VVAADRSTVSLWDPGTQRLSTVATQGWPTELEPLIEVFSVHPSDTPELADMLTDARPRCYRRGSTDDPLVEDALTRFGLTSVVVVPIVARGGFLGVVTAATGDGRPPLRRSEAQVKHQATHDGLTGLANRALFSDRLQAMLKHGTGVTVLFVDLDDFKAVNDGFGHVVGDDLLVAVSARLAARMRSRDTVARLGGDEFAMLLEGADERAAVQTAERLIDALGMPLALPGATIPVRASVGIAVASPGTSEVGEGATQRRCRDVRGQGSRQRPLRHLRTRHAHSRP
jgi:diguanylate cyclase (GGDEF)-like protein